MTITVVPNPTFSPPRNEITVSVPAGNVMKNPVLNRIVNGVTIAAPVQPGGGLDTRTVVDYEMPYDTPCVYEFATDYVSTVGTTVWDETWPNLSAWTPSGSVTFTASAGKATCTLTTGSGALDRAVTLGSYRVTIASMVATGIAWGSVVFVGQIGLQVTSAGLITIVDYKNSLTSTATTISAASPITIDFLGTSVSVSGTGGGWSSIARSSTDFSDVRLFVNAGGGVGTGTYAVGEIKITTYPTPSHLDQLSAPATVSPSQAWLIHPSNPGLSMPVSSRNRSAATIRTLGDVSNASQVTEHQILGQSLPITTTSGPRMGNKLQAVVGVRTAAQEQALMGLLADGTPILFRAPASYPIGLEEGYYSVGDITRGRLSQRLGDTMRDFTLPLTQVQRPAISVQNTGWSWATLAAQFPTWQAVAAAFNTWADVLTNNRKPGY